MTDDEVFRPLLEVGVTQTDDLRFQLLFGQNYLFFNYFEQAVACLSKAAEGLGPEIEDLRDLGLALCARAGETDKPRVMATGRPMFSKSQGTGA